jgi:hypothetical protein
VSRLRAVFANVLGKQPRRPQFVGIAEVLGFPAGQIDNEGPRFVGDDRLPPRPRAVIERRQHAQSFGSPHAALDSLVRHTDVSSNRVKGLRLTVGEQHSRPLDPAGWFRPRPGKPRQFRHLLVRERQLNNPPRSRHDPKASFNKSLNDAINVSPSRWNPSDMSDSKESVY